MYYFMDYKEAFEMLRKAGCNHAEIDRLTQFRKHFVQCEQDQTPTEQRRLEFMRWLFQKGRLTDYVV